MNKRKVSKSEVENDDNWHSVKSVLLLILLSPIVFYIFAMAETANDSGKNPGLPNLIRFSFLGLIILMIIVDKKVDKH